MAVAGDSLIQRSQQIISGVSQQADTAILFYSCGKDSIALLDLMVPHFSKVHVVFMYFVKGLEHIQIFLDDAQARYGDKIQIHQIPHWTLTNIFKTGFYCDPIPSLKLLKLKDLDNKMKSVLGCDFAFYGMKKADSLNRNLMLKGFTQPGVSPTNMVYPLQDWKNKDVLKYIEHRNLPKPVQYSQKRSSGLGFDLDVFLWLRQHYPNDLKLILQTFPLAERILFDHDNLNNG